MENRPKIVKDNTGRTCMCVLCGEGGREEDPAPLMAGAHSL